MMPVDPDSSGVITGIFLKLSMREYAYDILVPSYPEKSVKELLAESHFEFHRRNFTEISPDQGFLQCG